MIKSCFTCSHWDRYNKGNIEGKKPCILLQKLKQKAPLKGADDGYFCDLHNSNFRNIVKKSED